MRHKVIIWFAAIAVVFLIAIGSGVGIFYSPLLTHYLAANGKLKMAGFGGD